MSSLTRIRIVLVFGLCAALVMPIATAGGAAAPAQDHVSETWVAHLTGSAPADQGRVWLRETPCHRGVFFMLVSPRARATADHAVLTVDGTYLVTIPAEKLGFAIVLDEWPAEGFGDPSPAFVGWGAESPSPDVVYEALRSGTLGIEIFDASGEVLLSN